MYTKALSSLLIVSLVCCPVWCDSKLGSCCAEEQGTCEESLPPTASTADCCHECQVPQPPKQPSEGFPDPAGSCQGICGGAVLKELNQFDSGDMFYDVAADRLAAPCLPGLIAQLEGNFSATPSGHHHSGRMLRTLHMSFLC